MRVSCEDFLPFGAACGHVIEADDEEELIKQARGHALEAHPEEELDEERLHEAVRGAY